MNILKIFTDYRQLQIFILSIFSAIPLGIIYSTLSAWLKEEGIDIAIITTFAMARIFYSLKVLWAPFVDQIQIPILARIGHRKSWMVLCTITITVILFSMSRSEPNHSLNTLYFLTIALGIASATFDVVFDAFRIERFETNLQAAGVANTIFGYRIGILIAGAGALYFAELYGWNNTFLATAILYALCTIFILCISETKITRQKFNVFSTQSWKTGVIQPFTDFFKKDGATLILIGVIFFKLGDAFLGVVAMPFYLELGFSKTEIASVTKIFGLAMTIAGTYLGGYLIYRIGHFKGLIFGGIAQSITNASFIWLNHMGHDVSALKIAIAIENIASGLGTAALVGYLSSLCNKQFSATQYALLSGASGLFSHTIVVYGGSMVNLMGWNWYFFLTIIMGLPGIILFSLLNRKYSSSLEKSS